MNFEEESIDDQYEHERKEHDRVHNKKCGISCSVDILVSFKGPKGIRRCGIEAEWCNGQSRVRRVRTANAMIAHRELRHRGKEGSRRGSQTHMV